MSFVAVYVGQIRLEVIEAGEHGGKRHNSHDRVRENVILPHKGAELGRGEIREDRLKEHNYGADHLGLSSKNFLESSMTSLERQNRASITVFPTT